MTLVEAAIKEYEDLGINFQPLYPAVLVRVLPKEHMQGGIWLTDSKQNKPVYEGIVLRTYPPKRIKLDSSKWLTMDSGLSMGDHILFPHWSGEPVPWLRNILASKSVEAEEYRVIPARGLLSLAGMRDSGEPYLIVNYERESLDAKLKEILQQHDPDQGTCLDDEQVIELIKKEFDIIVKVKASKTVSGV